MSEVMKGKCHCEAIEFEVELESGFEDTRMENKHITRWPI